MPITFPSSNTTRDITNQIRDAIGRDVTFYVTMESDCPTCTIDPVSNTSVDSFCPTCSGVGYLHTLSGYTVNAHVTWGKHDILNWQSAGQLFDGDCRIQVEYLPSTVSVLDMSPYVVVDGKKLSIKNKILRGVPSINRILIDLIESESEV